MGVYFIAAGRSTDNRSRTLDRSHQVAHFIRFLSSRDAEKLRSNFPDGQGVYLWGANDKTGLRYLQQVGEGDFVVDFRNQEVPHIFRFCFFTDTGAKTCIQDFVEWDSQRRTNRAVRSFPYVFFLKSPRTPHKRNKQFFLEHFDLVEKRHYFDSQKFIDAERVTAAMDRGHFRTLEEFLGLSDTADSRLFRHL